MNRYGKEWVVHILIFLCLLLAVAAAVTGSSSKVEKVELVYPSPSWPIKGVDIDNDNVSDLVMEICLWNVASADGYARMTMYLNNNSIHYVQDLRNIKLKDESMYVHGYPEVFVGHKPWIDVSATDNRLGLPAKLDALNDFCLVVNYSLVRYLHGLPVNFAVDSWLTRERWSKGVEDGLETMVWLYSDGLNPGGRHVDTITVRAIVNGTSRELDFDVYYDERGFDEWRWRFVAFVSREPIRSGEVAIPFGVFVKKAIELANMNASNLYLEDVEIGSEFGSPTVREAQLEWGLYEFRLAPLGKPILSDGNADCTSIMSGGTTTSIITTTVTKTITKRERETITNIKTITKVTTTIISLTTTVTKAVYATTMLREVTTKTLTATKTETITLKPYTLTVTTTIVKTVAKGKGKDTTTVTITTTKVYTVNQNNMLIDELHGIILAITIIAIVGLAVLARTSR